MDEETERPIQVVAPIHVDTHEAEMTNLKSGSYLVFLEVHVSISTLYSHIEETLVDLWLPSIILAI